MLDFSQEAIGVIENAILLIRQAADAFEGLDRLERIALTDLGQIAALLDFYFALTSQSGTWTPEEMAAWQRAAGLEPQRPIRLRTAPGAGIQAAAKPR